MDYTKDQLMHVNFADDVSYNATVNFLRRILRQPDMAQLRKQFSFVEQWLALNPQFVQDYPDRAADLSTFAVYMKWESLQALTYPEPVLELFHQHINALFELCTDLDLDPEYFGPQFALVEGLRQCLTNIPLWSERDVFKKQILQALMSNEEEVTTAEFFRGIKAVPPTVKFWFSEYIEFMGTEPFIPERQKRFFRENSNAAELTVPEKDKLRLLFNVYERLRISSMKPAGIEEDIPFDADDGSTGTIKYGKIEFDDPAEKTRYEENFMKNIRPIMLDSGLYDVTEIIDLEPRPGVEELVVKTNTYTKPDSITTGPDIAATAGPDNFTDKDQAEIENLAQNPTGLVRKDDYVLQAQELKRQLQLTFTTPDLEKKFTDLLISVVRGLRDVMEFKQYLLDLHYPTAQVDTIVASVKQSMAKVNQVKSNRSTVLPGAVAPSLQATTPKFAQTKPTPQIKPTVADVGLGSMAATEQVEPAKPTTKKSFLPKLRRSRLQKKPIIDDVKLQPAMVMSPIDELRAMDVIEFRRLSPDPLQASARLKDKIELLGEESVTKQAEGIQAFKESPLNMQYLDIGNESIASGESMETIIHRMSSQGTASLTETEFNAVADLNRQLRF